MSDNTRGALIMMISMAAFTLNDTCIKLAGAELPLFQVLLMRGLMTSALIGLLAWRAGALRPVLTAADRRLIALRTLAEVAAAYFFLTALFNMPLANVTALLQVLPLTVTLGGALFFGETVGWRRALAIAIGFSGMLLIVRPGTEGFNTYTIYALIAVVCVTVRDLSARRMRAQVPSVFVALCASVAVMLFAGGALVTTGAEWAPVSARSAGLVALAAVFVTGGYLFSVQVMRIGDVAFVSPFRYTGLVWALVLGLLVFGEWPAPLTLAGAAIIAGTGIFTLYREGRARRRALRPARI